MTRPVLPLQQRAFLNQQEGGDSESRAALPSTSMSGLCGAGQGARGVRAPLHPWPWLFLELLLTRGVFVLQHSTVWGRGALR